jgi:excisionase family DNA binding protein
LLNGGSKVKEDRTVLTIPEAAKLLRISPLIAYKHARSGRLPSIRLGRRVLVPRAALDKFLAGEVASEQS